MQWIRMFGLGVAMSGALATTAIAQPCTPSQLQKLLPDGGDSFANYGIATSIAGDLAVVGQWKRDTDPNFDSGKAFVYAFNGSTWSQVAELIAPDAVNGDYFGAAVATDGTTIVVGAPYKALDGVNQAGQVYIYRDLGAGWVLVDTVRSVGVTPGDQFGSAVDVQGDTVVVGAYSDRRGNDSEAGSVFVFTESGGVFPETAFLQVPTASFRAHVGRSVAIDNGVLVAGANDEEGGSGNNGGAAYVWVFNEGWQLVQRLTPPNPQTWVSFGESIDIKDGVIVVGDPERSVTGASGGGAAFVYRPSSGGLWGYDTMITPSGVFSDDAFANRVSLADANTLVAGAHNDDDFGPQTGSAFVFRFDGSSWVQTGPFYANDRAIGDNFGWSVCADGNRAIIGAIGDDDFAPQSGSAYIFDLGCAPVCVPDFTGEGDLDFFDVQAFLQAFAAMDQAADLVDDDVFDFFDVQAFLQAFAGGCP